MTRTVIAFTKLVGRLGTRLLHDDAALAREGRRVHVVDVVDEAREETAQHRDRDRPDVELGDGPRVLDRDLGRRLGRELGEKAPELLPSRRCGRRSCSISALTDGMLTAA